MALSLKLIYPLSVGERRQPFILQFLDRGILDHLLALAAPRSLSSSSSSSSPGSTCLPPGEEWPSTLETLCVLAVGSLRRSGSFHDDWGHLDQLQGGFTILQGLTQIQDLRVRGGGKEKELVTWTHTGNQRVSFIAAEHSPVPSLQLLVCETVLCRNQGLSVRHKAQRFQKMPVCHQRSFFLFKKTFYH